LALFFQTRHVNVAGIIVGLLCQDLLAPAYIYLSIIPRAIILLLMLNCG